MFPKSIVVSAIALSSFALTPFSNGQQFRSGHLITVTPAPTTPSFGQVYGVADFNSDGRPDFLVTAADQSGTSTAALMLQNSNGTFTEKTISIPAGGPAGTTVTTDLNGDGKADIVTVVPAPVDVNHGDILGPATLIIGYGNGDGTFRVQAPKI
jgi:FG-GAP-like repeat